MPIPSSNYIDNYCERMTGLFWAEPVNAVTNAAFLVAAALAWHAARRDGRGRDVDVMILVVVMAVIGVGSFLFHTLATPAAMMADVIPIAVYQVTFLGLYASRVALLSGFRTIMLLVGFVAAGQMAATLPRDFMNGSAGYFPAFFFLLGFAIYHYVAGKTYPRMLLMAAGIFALSLTLRSVDEMLCAAWPMGTHFGWHMLNACVLYLTTRAYSANKAVMLRA